jgi:hypothetical protein
MAGLGRKRKKSKNPGTNRGHTVFVAHDENNENGSSNVDNGTVLVSPPPSKRIMMDKTNTASINSPISDILMSMDNAFKGTVTAPYLAGKIVELLENAFDKDDDIKHTMRLISEKFEELTEYEPPEPSTPQLEEKTGATPVTYKSDIFKFETEFSYC